MWFRVTSPILVRSSRIARGFRENLVGLTQIAIWGISFFRSISRKFAELFSIYKKRYYFGPASLLRLAALASNGAWRSHSIVFGFDMSIERRIGEVSRSSLASTDVLPTFLIFPRLPYFFFLDIGLLLDFYIVFYHIVVYHIHLLVSFCLPDGLFIEPLANRDKVLLWWLWFIGNSALIFCFIPVGMVSWHLWIDNTLQINLILT